MKPALVLVPGLLCTKDLYHHQITALKEQCDIIVPDHTRHETMSDIAQAILNEAPPSFSLGGLSMGGYICLEIMRQAPQRVKRLMLVDTSSRADTPAQTQHRKDLIKLTEMSGRFKGISPQFMKMLVHEGNLNNEAITSVVYKMALDVGKEAFVRQQTAIIGRIDARPNLPAITCPTAVICGEDDQITPVEVAREMADLIPNAQLHLVPKAGHLSPLEAPDHVSRLISEWMKK